MGLDKDTFHVVIRLPFKRPQGFVEPPSIVWTDEMEHKLWQYMSQKKTDWNFIAEQLGVPTSYVVRHAAFVYETQLRGIHQQLRMNGNNSTQSRNSTKSPTPSKPRPSSIRYSNTLQYQLQSQQLNQQESSQPKLQLENIESIQKSTRLFEKSKENVITTRSSPSTSTSDSLYKSNSTTTNSRIQTVAAYVNDSSEESDNLRDDDDDDDTSSTDDKSDEKEDEEFSNQFERMRLNVEEPAFLPQKSSHNDVVTLSNSRQQLSMSIQNLRKLNSFDNISSSTTSSTHSKNTTTPSSQPHSPITTTTTTTTSSSFQPSTAPGSSNESAMNSIGSSFSDLSDSSVTQSALEEAFLSKFNQGSKMSMLNFSRRYKE